MERSHAREMKTRLSPKQELFCKLFATERDFFGNGLQAYAKAYNLDLNLRGKKGIAKANASRLLTKANIKNRISELLDLGGLNDERVDKELLFLIEQNANLSVKIAAIREYNSLRKRIINKEEINITEEVNLTSFVNSLKHRSIEELQRMC